MHSVVLELSCPKYVDGSHVVLLYLDTAKLLVVELQVARIEETAIPLLSYSVIQLFVK